MQTLFFVARTIRFVEKTIKKPTIFAQNAFSQNKALRFADTKNTIKHNVFCCLDQSKHLMCMQMLPGGWKALWGKPNSSGPNPALVGQSKHLMCMQMLPGGWKALWGKPNSGDPNPALVDQTQALSSLRQKGFAGLRQYFRTQGGSCMIGTGTRGR